MPGRELQCMIQCSCPLVEPKRCLGIYVTRGTLFVELESIPGSCVVSTVSSQFECKSELTEEHWYQLWEMVEGAE